MTARKTVVPDQGENWCRNYLSYKETIDVSCITHFITHQAICWQNDFILKASNVNSTISEMPRSVLQVSRFGLKI